MAIGVGLVAAMPGTRPYLPPPPFDVFVPEVDLPVDDERYPYLRLIDPYDCTVFSAYQCQVIEPDFARLAEEQSDPKFALVLDLVRRCSVSETLWFLGD
jgi:hypothetical protein